MQSVVGWGRAESLSASPFVGSEGSRSGSQIRSRLAADLGAEQERPGGASLGAFDNARSSIPFLGEGLLTAKQVAEYVKCHLETVRRAYLAGRLKSVRFGVRGRRFRPADVQEW